MSVRRRRSAGLAVSAALLATAACGSAHAEQASSAPSPAQLAIADATRFLHSYVDSDGRVVRHDQGGDTVSEGQGYALLLAYAVGDRRTFASIWRWTSANLQLADGLFAFHWSGDQVTSSVPAADADVQIAWALDLAGARWSDAADTAAAKRIATAVADHEVGYDDQGQPTVAAGPWAVPNGSPITVEPGYWTYPADRALAALTGDHRWQAVAQADAAHLGQLTPGGRQLPADWAQLGNGSGIHAVGAPGGSGQAPASGADGMRAMVWARCATSGAALQRGWWQLIEPTAAAAPLSRTLAGAPVGADQAPLSDVAAAAAAFGAGSSSQANRLLDAADNVARRYPTYYGAAWAALGRVILTTGLIAGCSAGE